MLRAIISSSGIGETVLSWIEVAALATEVLAIMIIVLGIATSTIRYVILRFRAKSLVIEEDGYESYRHNLARSLLLGLEILVAADVVRTVALEASIQSVTVLGILVLIRTFLSWSLTVEIDGRWPWQAKRKSD
jgi:uncharacterized membrane protein